MTSLEPLISYLHVPEREYRRIDPGQTATIAVDALRDITFDGIVARIGPVVDPQTGTFKITIEVTDSSRRLKPGMFGRISVVYDQHANVLQVPRSAIIDEVSQTSVFVVENDIAVRKAVETGFSDAGMIEITSGLTDDDDVVTVGQIGLKPDARVTVINADEATEIQVTENAPTD